MKHKIQKYRNLSGRIEAEGLLEWLKIYTRPRDKKRRKTYFGGWQVKADSQRYTVFRNSLKCAFCDREIVYGILQQTVNLGNNNPIAAHFNFYSEDGMLFTKDHIIPKSKGGKNRNSNYQTCCYECNARKGDQEL